MDFQDIELEKIAGGFQFTEGPVWVRSRDELIFSDIPANRLYRWKDGTADVWRDPSGNANGNTLDPQGRLLTCEHGNRRVSRTEPDGSVTTLADRFETRRLNSPNDVACRSDGAIYFTDPPYGVKPELRELDFQGVYRIWPDDKSLALLLTDFNKPNGLVFSPDENILYIADTEASHVRAFDLAADGALANGRVFCPVDRPDGMRVDRDGNLYVAAQTAVEVFSPAGEKLAAIPVPERPANLAFGDADGKSLYITARTSLYRLRLGVAGCLPGPAATGPR
jgi:sugar lactone lactonase YvrE